MTPKLYRVLDAIRDTFSPQSRHRYVWDLETDNLLSEVTKVHCAVLYNIDTDEMMGFRPDQLGKFLEYYVQAEMLIGHNSIGFDREVIKKLYKLDTRDDVHLDTMILGRLVYSDIKSMDFPLAASWKKFKQARETWLETERKFVAELGGAEVLEDWEFNYPHQDHAPQEFPGQFIGGHSLEAWGYRLGAERKGDYSKEMKAKGLDPWASFNEAMFDYMLQDGVVTVAVYRHLMDRDPTAQSVTLEMAVQRLCSSIEREGWPFNVQAAQELYGTLSAERHILEKELLAAFPPWEARLEDFIPKRDNKARGYLKGVPVEKWETIEFNPNSREHIADRLIHKYGWNPTEFTDGGSAKVDDEVLQKLSYPEAQKLARFFTIAKRIAQVAEGAQAWLKQVSKKGKIHARYTINGAVTGRATHSNPNIAQVPAVGAPFGRDCRSLFHVPTGWTQLGADQAGLELRCLGTFLFPWDGGAYMEVVLHGDVHFENAKALFGLPDDLVRDDENPQHKKWRNVAKTFIYAFLYGAGDAKLGSIIGKGAAAGKQLRARFLKRFPALAALIKYVKKAAQKGFLRGMDGRIVPIRSDHAALNTLLQSAGALVCKSWIVLAHQGLIDAGLKNGWDGDFVFLGWIHDEIQVAARNGLEDKVSAIIIDAGRHAGDQFSQWKCPTEVDVKSGRNWADCH